MGWANVTHQLLVSVSRHLYVDRHGVLKYQVKPMDVNINNYGSSKKEHLVYYVLRDEFSGNFIFDVTGTASLIPLLDFLHYAWKQDKDDKHFWGLPVSLSVPKRISSPELLDGLHRLGVEVFHPSSGFSSGIRILRDLEDNLCFYLLSRSAIHSLDNVQKHKDKIYSYMLRIRHEDNKAALWRETLASGHPQEVPDYDSFIKCFSVPAAASTGLMLLPAGGEEPAGNRRQLDFLAKPVTEKKFSAEKLRQAEDIIREAWQHSKWPERLKLGYKALRLSPYCGDAYNLLAAKSDYLDEKIMLYQRGVQAAELSLGELFFKRNRGHFGDLEETGPYMRSLHGLAQCLWKKGRREEALDIYREMLELDPDDNIGIRFELGFRLLDAERHDELEKLLRTYNEAHCFVFYNQALCRFRTRLESADQVLHTALRANELVPAYLLGEERVPYSLPDCYSPGSKEEAEIYAGEAGAAWRETAGALDWLREVRSVVKEGPVLAAEPNIAGVLRDFLEEQAGVLSKRTLDEYKYAFELLQICLDSYGYQILDDAEEKLLERCLADGGDEDQFIFSRLFGPEKIPDIMREFFGYFMVRKVVCGKDQLRTTGTAVKKLARWLADRGYIAVGEGAEMAATAASASRELPAADELSEALFNLVDSAPPVRGDAKLDDLFTIVKVEPGKLHLETCIGEAVAVAVPRRISSICKVGWSINLLLVKTNLGWRIAESGRVYPL